MTLNHTSSQPKMSSLSLQRARKLRDSVSATEKTPTNIVGFTFGVGRSIDALQSDQRPSELALSPDLETSLIALKRRAVLASGILEGLRESITLFQKRINAANEGFDTYSVSEVREVIRRETGHMQATLLATSSDLLKILNAPLLDGADHHAPSQRSKPAQRCQQRQREQSANA